MNVSRPYAQLDADAGGRTSLRARRRADGALALPFPICRPHLLLVIRAISIAVWRRLLARGYGSLTGKLCGSGHTCRQLEAWMDNAARRTPGASVASGRLHAAAGTSSVLRLA